MNGCLPLLAFLAGLLVGLASHFFFHRRRRALRLVVRLGAIEKQLFGGMTMADLSVAFADDEQVGVTFSEVDDKGNPVADVEQVTMTSEDESIATIGTLHDGTTPAIVASGKVGATIVDCETPSGLKASIAVAVGTSAPVGLSATFGTPEKQ